MEKRYLIELTLTGRKEDVDYVLREIYNIKNYKTVKEMHVKVYEKWEKESSYPKPA